MLLAVVQYDTNDDQTPLTEKELFSILWLKATSMEQYNKIK